MPANIAELAAINQVRRRESSPKIIEKYSENIFRGFRSITAAEAGSFTSFKEMDPTYEDGWSYRLYPDERTSEQIHKRVLEPLDIASKFFDIPLAVADNDGIDELHMTVADGRKSGFTDDDQYAAYLRMERNGVFDFLPAAGFPIRVPFTTIWCGTGITLASPKVVETILLARDGITDAFQKTGWDPKSFDNIFHVTAGRITGKLDDVPGVERVRFARYLMGLNADLYKYPIFGRFVSGQFESNQAYSERVAQEAPGR